MFSSGVGFKVPSGKDQKKKNQNQRFSTLFLERGEEWQQAFFLRIPPKSQLYCKINCIYCNSQVEILCSKVRNLSHPSLVHAVGALLHPPVPALQMHLLRRGDEAGKQIRQTYRQTDRQTSRQADKQTNRQTERQTDNQNKRTDRQTGKLNRHRQTGIQASRQTDKQATRLTGYQTIRQTDKLTIRLAEKLKRNKQKNLQN